MVNYENGDFNPCIAMLSDGLRDVYTTTSNVSFFSDSKEYFASDQFINDYHTGKWNGGISLIIDDVPIGLNAGASNEDIHQFQQKIRQSNSVIVKLQTYSTISRSTINVDLANAYNKCIEDHQIYGLSIDLNGSTDLSALVTIKYKPLADGDPHPTIAYVQLIGLSNKETQDILDGQLRIGNTVEGEMSFSASRQPKQELIVVINTSNGLSAVKRLEASDDIGSELTPIGTVISSMLDFDSFSKLTKNNNDSNVGIWSPTKSKWSPCDGRSLTGSKYQTLWAGSIGSNAPDLRGVFLRGLNQFDVMEPTPANTVQANPENKKRGDFQPDALIVHNHNYDRFDGIILNDISNDTDQRKASLGTNRAVTTSVPNTPTSTETRPKNVSIYYYLRIN